MNEFHNNGSYNVFIQQFSGFWEMSQKQDWDNASSANRFRVTGTISAKSVRLFMNSPHKYRKYLFNSLWTTSNLCVPKKG